MLPIDVASMSDSHDHHDQQRVFNLVDDPKVANAYAVTIVSPMQLFGAPRARLPGKRVNSPG